jgi:ribose transport system ATP-binding protein
MGDVIFELKSITKYFPGVIALSDMNFQVRAGEVHGLIGENGAGKSTLIKVLTGVNKPDKGQIIMNGAEVTFSGPYNAMKAGVGCVYQELNIVPQLNIIDNLFIGHHVKKANTPLLDYKQMKAKTSEIMSGLGADVDPLTICSNLGLGVQQTVEIGKSILHQSKLIIMDEPTSSLSEKEVKELMVTIHRLKQQNIAIIFVSHKLEEIFEICDVVTVMRDGKHVSTTPVKDMTKDKLIADMVGRSLENLFPKKYSDRGEEFLRVENLKSVGVFKDIKFTAYAGEILGFSGLVGAGRTQVFRSIFGVDPLDEGEIFIKGKKVTIKSPADAIKHKIAFLTEDRKGEGLILEDSVLNNVNLATIDTDTKLFFLDFEKRKENALKNVEQLKIKTPNLEVYSGTLSGGNQQKVVIGKWLNTDADIYIFDEPTRGIDVGAKIEVYNIMNELTQSGKCVVMISSELPEILGMSDRVIVMREGRITGEIDKKSLYFNQEGIMKAAWGGTLS